MGILLKAGATSKKVDYFTQKRLVQALRRRQSPIVFKRDATAKKLYGSYAKLEKKFKADQEKNESKEDQDPKLREDMKRIKNAAQRDAKDIAQALYERGTFFLRCNTRPDKASRRIIVELVPQRSANPHEFIAAPDETPKEKEKRLASEYVWIYEGSQTKRTIMMVLIIGAFLAMTAFPMWPQFMKMGVWYTSVTFLIFMAILVIVRTILFTAGWFAGWSLWIFPNIFAEVGILDSFRPAYRFRRTEAVAWWARIVGFFVLIVFGYWVYQQPTEFDEYISIQRQFIDDLYSGKMISDMSASSKEDLDAIKVPTFEEMQNMFTEDEDDAMEA